MPRDALASSPALKSFFGSFKEAPLKKLSLTWSLNTPAATTFPLCDHTGVSHFHSSASSGEESRINLRNLTSILPRQSGRLSIYSVMRSDGDFSFAILSPLKLEQCQLRLRSSAIQ